MRAAAEDIDSGGGSCDCCLVKEKSPIEAILNRAAETLRPFWSK